jgi:oxygen-independent coproporphyrinogen-3 oxidase
MLGIYIHIPFCLKKCSYCDFHSVTGDSIPQKEYTNALLAEIDILSKEYHLTNQPVATIYFGGGTPTIFDAKFFSIILEKINKKFSVAQNAEITVEANPETLTQKKIKEFSNICNRLSIGIQTFNDKHLQQLGRIHSSDTAKSAIKDAQKAGFKNIGIDLMWGLPDQTIKELEHDLSEAVLLQPQHISAYQLTTDRLKNLPDDEISRKMWLLVHNKLTDAGYTHYEISNYNRTIAPSDQRTRCRHNENYWHYGEWLGLGSGATSQLIQKTKDKKQKTKRFTVKKDVEKYLMHNFEYEFEDINPKTAMAEYCFLGLRTSDGINLDEFKSRFGVEFDSAYPKIREKWIADRLAEQTGGNFHLIIEGMLISDELFQNFV